MDMETYIEHQYSQDYPFILSVGRDVLRTVLEERLEPGQEITLDDKGGITGLDFDLEEALLEEVDSTEAAIYDGDANMLYADMVSYDGDFYETFTTWMWNQIDATTGVDVFLDIISHDQMDKSKRTNPFSPITLVPFIEFWAAHAVAYGLTDELI